MNGTELDMELTPERKARIKETLIRLYADQYGLDYDSLEITIIPKQKVEPA